MKNSQLIVNIKSKCVFDRLLIVACSVCLYASASLAGEPLSTVRAMDAATLLLMDAKQHAVIAQQAERPMIPASTIKLVTALAALQHWGREHRFTTEFSLHQPGNILVVKGLGDPFLVSEELDVIASKIQRAGIRQLGGIMADTRYFDTAVNLPVEVKTNNPYHAAASALAANFNTIEVKLASGRVSSGEAQTPLTPMAESLAQGLPAGKHRINLGAAGRGPEYFVELLTAKLRLAGVEVGTIAANSVDTKVETQQLFVHANSRSLAQVVSAMLEYSNNFIASQLFLLLGVEQFGAPASLQKSQRMVAAYIESHFDWRHYQIEDGAGLSRANRLSAQQLVDVLQALMAYRDVMPRQNDAILAKSGTLNGVSCYAGYLYRENEWQTFALMINQPVAYGFRERLAEALRQYPDSGG